jgi:hypothetical protein
MLLNRLYAKAVMAALFTAPALAQAPAPLPVTADNFIRAESDTYAANLAKEGGLGKLLHRREPAPIQSQTVIRLNRDTLYTSGVFDLDAGPVTITLPDAGERFMSLQSISQDHYATTAYSLNNITAEKAADGSVAVQFGGCDGKTANCLPTMPGWNYMVRLYRPQAAVLNGSWTFPEARPVN